MQRNITDVSEVELNFMDFQRIGESIERLLRCGFEIFDNTGDLVNRRLIDQTARSINEQTNIVVKLNIRRKLHWVSFIRGWLFQVPKTQSPFRPRAQRRSFAGWSLGWVSAVDSNGRTIFVVHAVTFSYACTTKIVRPLESTAETQPKLQPALLSLSAMVSQSLIGTRPRMPESANTC